MKTRTSELRVLYEDPVKQQGSSFARSITTANGDLMTSRMSSMLSTYGDRVQVPNKLVLEILRNRDKASHRLKVAQRQLREFGQYAEAVEVDLEEAYITLANLLDAALAFVSAVEDNGDIAMLDAIDEELENLAEAAHDASSLLEYEGVFDEDAPCEDSID